MRTRTPLHLPLRELHSLLRDGVASGLTDQELLQRFATGRDQAGELAFATLVARHGPMVLSVCRRMLRNPADADDAFQATFLVLVRRAGAMRFGESLGPWLYGVSVRVARRARELGSRHRLVELDDEHAKAIPERDPRTNRDLRFAVDEALARLPVYYRAAIVLCYLEGLTHEEAADQLRCPVGTVRSRLARGRALLKDRLERSDMGPISCLFEPATGSNLGPAHSVVSSHLADTTARIAARLASGQPLAEIVPARLAGLVAGASRTMTISKLTMTASLIVFAGLAAWGAAGLAAQAPGGKAPSPRPASPAAPVVALVAIEAAAQPSQEATTQREESKIEAHPVVPDDLPPVVLEVVPKVGAIDVDPGLREIRVTFSKTMTDQSWSFTEGNVYAVPKPDGKIHYTSDKRTCVMPVKLQPGKTYVLGINSERFRGFKDSKGRPALPYLVVFRTKSDK